MKVIIPAKRNSSRVQDKNWRPFYKDKNLVQIKIEQLLTKVLPVDIYLSCDDEEMKKYAAQYGINFILRAPALASDNTPWSDAVKGMVEEMPVNNDEDIAWVEVINPLFSDFDLLFEKWNQVKAQYDSLVLVSPVTKFLLHNNGAPVNFMPGKWHAMSQNLDPLYAWDSVCIMSKKNILYFSYPIGKTPYLFSTESPCIDIDTLNEFELAQLLFAQKI